MSNKTVTRINKKILADAKQYLTLVRNVITIQKALTMGADKDLSPEKVEFVNRVGGLVEGASEVCEAVLKATKELSDLPSSAPNHTRRKAGKELNTLLASRAMSSHELMSVILESTDFVEEEEAVENE